MCSSKHQPVMLQEVLEFLAPEPSNVFVDATLGGGGYSAALLQAINGEGLVIGIDRDEEALAGAIARLSSWGEAFKAYQANFSRIIEVLEEAGEGQVNGIVADLGLSSMQLSDPARGFSFQTEGPLDMRFGMDEEHLAEEVVNFETQANLERIFREYGEERFARRIAREIVARRRQSKIRTTLQLADLIRSVVPARRGKIHPATKVFQSLRIVTNDEMTSLQKLCEYSEQALKPGGVFVCVSYHSLEDRIVKQHFRSNEAFERLTKKPLRPTEQEVADNPRSRSARLRAAIRR